MILYNATGYQTKAPRVGMVNGHYLWPNGEPRTYIPSSERIVEVLKREGECVGYYIDDAHQLSDRNVALLCARIRKLTGKKVMIYARPGTPVHLRNLTMAHVQKIASDIMDDAISFATKPVVANRTMLSHVDVVSPSIYWTGLASQYEWMDGNDKGESFAWSSVNDFTLAAAFRAARGKPVWPFLWTPPDTPNRFEVVKSCLKWCEVRRVEGVVVWDADKTELGEMVFGKNQ